MDVNTLSPIVWADYRLAVLFTVTFPLILLLWAVLSQVEAIQRLLIIYWKVSSLLAITVLLLIAAQPYGFFTGWVARILIPVCLWFWVDLNDDISDLQPWRPLKVAFNSWRWAITLYSALGTIFSLSFFQCALKGRAFLFSEPSACRLWLEPPWGFREYFLMGYTPDFLGVIGTLGLLIYGVYFAYFVIYKLSRQGRSATGQ
jgi:hypothetical protein